MELNKGIEIKAGRVKGMIFGGPFRRYVPGTRRLVGVKMAVEIDHPHDISVPTHDFSTPTPAALVDGINQALTSMAEGNDVYAGCMGGIGRTGLFMAVTLRAVAYYNRTQVDAISEVRRVYHGHAVETAEQRKFVNEFDIRPIVKHLRTLNVKQRTEYVKLSVWESLVRWFKRKKKALAKR